MNAAPLPPTPPPDAPIAAQWLWHLFPRVPAAREMPVTSEACRAALNDAAGALGWPLRPSRRELARANDWLEHNSNDWAVIAYRAREARRRTATAVKARK